MALSSAGPGKPQWHKSGLKPTAYKRAFNFATEREWFLGGGGQGKPYYLNPNGSWRTALGPGFLTGPNDSNLHPETGSTGPGSDVVQTKIDGTVALASEAIRHANKG
jgi:hypothetical protein